MERGAPLYTKTVYFAGGSFYELQEVFSRVPGVTATQTGYINALTPTLTHEAVLAGVTGAAMGVEVTYDPKKIDLSSLMDILFAVVNPYVKDKQGDCVGPMYRSGVYFTSAEDEPIVSYHMNFIRNRKKTPAATEAALTVNDTTQDLAGARRCYAEAMRLQNFQPADPEHQDYLKQHPETKTHIDFGRLLELKIIR